MKKIIAVFALAAGLSACTDNGRAVESGDAEKVEVTKTETTSTFKTVKSGSAIDWRASHLGGVQPRFGKIFAKSAEVLVNGGKITNAKVVMDMASFTVENFEDEESKKKLTGHLQGDDFFKIATHPTATFELTKIDAAEGDYNSTITGNLTILDATKSITFKGNVATSETEVTIKSEDFAVNRTDWNLTYNVEGTEGVPADYIIANDIGFTINMALTK